MQSFFENYPDNTGRSQFAPGFPDYIEDIVLAAGALTRIAVPTGARFAVFSFDGDVRVKLGDASTALALPSASTTTGSGSELNPSVRRIAALQGREAAAVTHVCLIAPTACTGSLSFYA